ncbi:hypothetical protein PBPRA1586 [Photobacterium profundum SS9]|uniref:Uncharacterized protein n=1 Tax=Photobacterium profundum (strain SS9) TaxID=298386 RepID=Q6LRS9_PHOPR|nr:hypothetical protein PBPRA1586 [Photobacterium profundum SS9]
MEIYTAVIRMVLRIKLHMSLLRIFGLVAFQHTPLGHVVGEGSISIKAIKVMRFTRRFWYGVWVLGWFNVAHLIVDVMFFNGVSRWLRKGKIPGRERS